MAAVAGGICGQVVVEGQYAGRAAAGQGRAARLRGGEGREEAGEEAGTCPVADLDQEGLILESWAGSLLAERQVCTGGDGEGVERPGKAEPDLESV